MEISMSGWSAAACIWGLVALAAYLLKISKQWVHAYRVRQGRMQMNQWLFTVGKHLDMAYKDGTPYSKTALKKWLAELSVMYFKEVIKKREE